MLEPLIALLAGCGCPDPGPGGTPTAPDVDLPDSDTAVAWVPTDTGSLRWVDIDMGFVHACGVLNDGRLVCWGEDDFVALASDPSPVYQAVSLSGQQGCGLRLDGSVRCWCPLEGDAPLCAGAPAEVDAAFPGFVRIEVGDSAACGELPDGTLQCWGGATNPTVSQAPEAPVLHWDVGWNYGCAILEDRNELICWGNEPVAGWQGVLPPEGVVFEQIGVGRTHACGLDLDGHAHCWGRSGFGDEYDYRAPFPSPPAGAVYSSLESYNQVTCALDAEGWATCWYDVPVFEDLDGPDVTGAPKWAPPDERWERISLGEWDACGVTLEGEAHCWPDVMSDNEGEISELPSLESLEQ